MNKNISELCGIFFSGSYVKQKICLQYIYWEESLQKDRKEGRKGRSNRRPTVDRAESTSQGSNKQT